LQKKKETNPLKSLLSISEPERSLIKKKGTSESLHLNVMEMDLHLQTLSSLVNPLFLRTAISDVAAKKRIQTTANIARKLIGENLTDLSDAGLIHGDLKDGNFMTDASMEQIYLGDFSMITIDLDGFAEGTQEHSAVTVGYVAPEYYKLNGQQSRESDLFAVAGILYRLITGYSPISDYVDIVEVKTFKSEEQRQEYYEMKVKQFSESPEAYEELRSFIANRLNIYGNRFAGKPESADFEFVEDIILAGRSYVPAERIQLLRKRVGNDPAVQKLLATYAKPGPEVFKHPCTQSAHVVGSTLKTFTVSPMSR